MGGTFGWQELLLILVILLVLFGGSRLPGIARSLRESLNEFRKGMPDDEESQDSTSSASPDRPS